MIQHSMAEVRNDDLWIKLEKFQFDPPGCEGKFALRLARENAWSLGYSFRVVEEYRKFLYLMVRASHPVSPSHAVDQAWHLHLIYTHSYWDDLCGQIVGSPLHHVPGVGREGEHEKFQQWYRNTLESYKSFYGEPAPLDIWGTETPKEKKGWFDSLLKKIRRRFL